MKLKFLAIMLAAFFAACSSGGDDIDGGTDGGDGGAAGGTEEGTGGDTSSGDAFADSFAEENDTIKFSVTSNNTYGVTLSGNTIYVDAENGSDSNSGANSTNAIKTLTKLNSMSISSGDQILLCGGQTHTGTIELKSISVSGNKWIHVGSYGSQKACIDAVGQLAGINIQNTSNVIVSDVKISANGGASNSSKARYGIYVYANGATTMENIVMYNVDIRNIFYFSEGDASIPTDRPCRTWSANGSDYYGYGIVGIAGATTPTTYLNDITIEECNINNVSNIGIQFRGGDWNGGLGEIYQLNITGSTCSYSGGPGSNFWRVFDSEMTNTRISNSGDPSDPRNWGRGSGMWLIYCKNFLFEGNIFENASGIADSCGAHIDLENENVVIQRCLSRNNAGGFIELLGDNKNCAYRYNISIGDGWRNTSDTGQYSYWGWDGSNNSATPGVLMSISGYYEGEQFQGPYQSYIYNNTIVLDEKMNAAGYTNPMKFEIATTTVGLVVANNIFWVPERMTTTSSTHTASGGTYENAFDFKISASGTVRAMTTAEINAMDLVIDNNLFEVYNANYASGYLSLPENYWCDGDLNGDPGFKNVSGTDAEDMIPTNSSVINSGIAIEQLSTDSYGLEYGDGNGLNMTKDFFGNTITTPIVGAVVCQ
ncbi:MAG: hypothetical protein SNH13_06295 [Rikenellaceae bacterium]